MAQLLGSDGVLALPTSPGPAVHCNTPEAELNEWRKGLLSLTCVAGLAGLPQVVVGGGAALCGELPLLLLCCASLFVVNSFCLHLQ